MSPRYKIKKLDRQKLVVGFDADDTLWHNETLFADIQERLRDLVTKYVAKNNLDERLVVTERENLNIFGYGIKSFTLSMIETAVKITENKISAEDIHQILEWGKEMLRHPIQLIDNVENIIAELSRSYTLALITKGELFQQETRIATSGLADYFSYIEIMSQKRPEDYESLFTRHNIDINNFVMVGNSLYSDILPIVELGGCAVYIPYHITWELEEVEASDKKIGSYLEAKDITEIGKLLKKLAK